MIHVLPSVVKSQDGPRGEVNPDSCLQVTVELNRRRNAFRLRKTPKKRKGKEKEKMRLVHKRVFAAHSAVL